MLKMIITKEKMEKDRQLTELLYVDDGGLNNQLLTNFGLFETNAMSQHLAQYVSEINEHISANLIRSKTHIICELQMIEFTGGKYSEVEIQNGFHELDLKLAYLDKRLVGPFDELRKQVEDLKAIDEQCYETEMMMELQKYLSQFVLNESTEDYQLLGK